MSVIHSSIRLPGSGVPGPAEVLEVDEACEYVRVCRQGSWDGAETWARLAIPGEYSPEVGDEVLVFGEQPDDLYVIGCLKVRRKTSRTDQTALQKARQVRLETASGICAECGTNADGHETLRVLSPGNELLFEADPSAGITRLAVPQGSLEILAGQGDLTLRSGHTVRIEGRFIEMNAVHRLTMTVAQGLAAVRSVLRLLPHSFHASIQDIEVFSRKGKIKIDSADVAAEQLSVAADQCQLSSRKIEIDAETIIQRAGNVYQSVRELLQLQTGRLRTYVSGLSHFRSKTAYISAEETVHIDGSHVELG